ncbi:MAG: ferrichrome ABC transporter permease [Archangium sp.]|nr:ferrichrome ABC transporter permease [Archangium sp.]
MGRISVTVVLSAFLLFLVQPLIGKVVLPWFGGAPAVWTTCLLFFQVVLLAGYAWSHFIKRLGHAGEKRAHLTMLTCAGVSVIVMVMEWGTPLIPSASWRPVGSEAPTRELLVLLASTVGLPYFALSSTGPLLQQWVAQKVPAARAMRLYAVSNIGSLIGLLAFPVLLEPFWPLKTLAWAWSGAFLIFVVLCGSVAFAAPAREEAETATPQSPTPSTVARWIVLAALPSALLLAMTNHLTQDVAPVPFLWVAPLVIYLASFVVTFDSERWYRRTWALPALGVFGFFVAVLLFFPTEPSALFALSGYLGFLAVACVTAHGELVGLRPEKHQLTAFYLSVSVGGAVGGVSIALIAPRVLSDFYELQLCAAALPVWVAIEVARREPNARLPKVFLAIATLLAILFGWSIATRGTGVIERRRDFFGVLRVEQDPRGKLLMHGRVLHGSQLNDPGSAAGAAGLKPSKHRLPTAYYAPGSGVGRLLASLPPPRRVGLIGLGVGTIAGYAREGDTFRFYEISPTVVALAEGAGGHFTFLSGAPGGKPEVVTGDARTSLEREQPNAYDVLVVDAFSGDSVPTHLLTKEAFALYLSHLKNERSVLALHVSNRYLDLMPVVAREAKEFSLHSLVVDTENDEDWAIASLWVLLSKDANALKLDVAPAKSSTLEELNTHGPLWTDEFTSLWGLVQW